MQTKIAYWISGIAAIIMIVLFAFLIYVFAIKPNIGHAISTCQTDKCVKSTAMLYDFNIDKCAKAPTLDLQNKCYYYYQANNKQSGGDKSVLGCNNIKDVDLIIKCYAVRYKKYIPFFVDSYVTAIDWSISKLNMEICNKVSDKTLQEQCVNGVLLAKKAIYKKDPSICKIDKNFKISNFARDMCFKKVTLTLSK